MTTTERAPRKTTIIMAARGLWQIPTPDRWVHRLCSPGGPIWGEAAADAGNPVTLALPPGVSDAEYWVNKADGRGFVKRGDVP